MAKGVNKVILLGNLGNNPEVHYTRDGNPVVNIILATTEPTSDKELNESPKKTEWHRVVFFNRLVEIVGKNLHKGSKIYVEGRLHTRRWIDKQNIERFTTEILAKELHIIY